MKFKKSFVNYVAYLNEEEKEWVSYNGCVKPRETALFI
jgi:hypothetical protein